MDLIKNVTRNAGILAISDIINKFLGLLYVLYIARYLGAENYGIISYAIAFSAIIGICADLGFGTLMVREVSRDKNLTAKYVNNIFLIKLIITFIILFISFLITSIMDNSQKDRYIIYLICFSTLINNFSGIFNSIFQAHEKMEYYSLNNILNSVLMIVLTYMAIWLKLDVIYFALIYCIVNVIILLVSYLICSKKFVKPGLEMDLEFINKIVKKALPFSLTIMIGAIFFNIDLIVLGRLPGNENVGYYRSSLNIIMIYLSSINLFIYAIFPITSQLYLYNTQTLKRFYELLFKYLIIISLLLSSVTFGMADRIILFLYGPEFAPAIDILKILSLCLPFKFAGTIMGWMLASVNKEPLRTFSAGIAAAINITGDFMVVMLLGTKGVSIIMLISQVTLFIFYLHYLNKHFYYLHLFKMVIKPIFSSSIVILFLYYFNTNSIAMIVGSSLIYFAILYAIKTFTEYDISIFRQFHTTILNQLGFLKANRD